MGAASWEHPGSDDDQEQGARDGASPMPADSPANDAMRSWLARGIHTFGIDSRRLGGRGLARRVLGEDRRSALDATGAWRELASALQRHTLHNALTRLNAAERQVVTLAYLEGRTNRQIAAILGVSVSTVRRRLWLALEHLDEYVHRTGTWVSSILLLGLAYLVDQSARLGRFVNPAAATDWPHRLAATVAVGAVAAAGVGVVATNLHSSSAKHGTSRATTQLTQSPPGATWASLPNPLPFAPGTSPPIAPSKVAPLSATTPASKAITAVSDTNDEQTEQGESASNQSEQGDNKAQVATNHATQSAAGHDNQRDASPHKRQPPKPDA